MTTPPSPRPPDVDEVTSGVVTVVVPVGRLPGLADVDEAARACLEVRRAGGHVLEVRAPPALLELLRLAGLGPGSTGGCWSAGPAGEVRLTYVDPEAVTPPRGGPPAAP